MTSKATTGTEGGTTIYRRNTAPVHGTGPDSEEEDHASRGRATVEQSDRLADEWPPLTRSCVCWAQFLNTAGFLCASVSRMELLKAVVEDEDCTTTVATSVSVAAAVEFLATPLLGERMDAVGRKGPLALVAALGTIPRLLVLIALARGRLERLLGRSETRLLLSAVLVLERVAGQASYGLFQTGCSALCSDLAAGGALVGLSTRAAGFAALGVVLGPLAGGRMAQLTGSPIATFFVSALLGALQTGLTAMGLPETLPPERRSAPRSAQAPRNPLAMLRLFTTSPTLTMLATSTLLQCLTENKSILDICTAYASSDIGWTSKGITRFIAFFGACWVTGTLLAKKFVDRFGVRHFTTGSNLLAAAGFALWASKVDGTRLILGTAVMMWGLERRAGTTALMLKANEAAGGPIGTGELHGMVGNLKASTLVVAPLVYSSVYSWAKRNGVTPALPFAVASMSALAAEALHQTIPDSAFQS